VFVRRCAAVLVLAVLLAGCSRGDDIAAPEPWEHIDLPGTVSVVVDGRYTWPEPPHVLVGGEDDGAGVVLDVTAGRGPVAVALPGVPDPIWHLSSDGNEAVASAGRGGAGSDVWYLAEMYEAEFDGPRDEAGDEPVWAAPTVDGEGDLRVAGVVPEGDRWRVRAWMIWDDWERMDAGPALYVPDVPRSGELLVAATEVGVVIAGDLATERSAAAPSVWFIWDSAVADEVEGGGEPWIEETLVPQPDALTDIRSWEGGWWVAGHRSGAPLIYDFDGRGGVLEVPDVRLDLEQPTVLLAAVALDGDPLLVLRTVDGPGAWYRVGGTWHEMPLPDGDVQDAEYAEGLLYVVVDGELFAAELPADYLAEIEGDLLL
jgi:hypothetical protein